jgi:hypothetical protein
MLLRCPFPVEDRPPGWWSRGLPGLALLVTLVASCLSARPGDLVPPPLSTAPVAGTFRVARIDLPARPAGPKGRAPFLELPLRLPDRFDLTIDVWASTSNLVRTRVVGLPLALTPAPAQPGDPERWHTVRVHRDWQGLDLEVDGHHVTTAESPRCLTYWLAVEPAPERDGHFRALRLAW